MSNSPFEDNTPDESVFKKIGSFFSKMFGSINNFPNLFKRKNRWEEDHAIPCEGMTRSGPAFITSLVVFILWGLIGGYLVYSRCEYWFARFGAYAYDKGILDGRLISTPLTLVVDILLFVGFTVVFLTLAAGIYMLLSKIFYRKDPLSAQNNLAFCYMISVCIAIVEFFIIISTAFNMFYS